MDSSIGSKSKSFNLKGSAGGSPGQLMNTLISKKQAADNLSYQKVLLRLSKPELTFSEEQVFTEDVFSSNKFRESMIMESKTSKNEDLTKIRFDRRGNALSRSMLGPGREYHEYIDKKEMARKLDEKRKRLISRASGMSYSGSKTPRSNFSRSNLNIS